MTVFDTFLTSYVKESTWNTDAIANVTTPTYWLGVLADRTRLPEPVTTLHQVFPGPGSREADDTVRLNQHFRAQQVIGVQNGFLLYLALGKISNATSGSDYIHTITPASNATTGVCGDRPSITIHQEATDRAGALTGKSRHYTGCQLAALRLEQSAEAPILVATADWIAGNATTWSHTSLTTDPTDFGSGDPYDFSDTTITYDGNSIKTGLTSVIAEILQNTYAVYGQRGSDSHLPQFLVDPGLVQYRVELRFEASDILMWEDTKTGGSSADKDLVVKFQKTATDYIQLTFTNVQPYEPFYDQPEPGKPMEAAVWGQPEALSVEVKDAVSAY